MNYYNPYMNYFPYTSMPSAGTGGLLSGLLGNNSAVSAARPGLLSGLFRNGINWGSILSNTQRTLGIVNQAIPVVKQVSPVLKNAKTMFKVMNEFKRVDTPVSTTNRNDSVESEKKETNNSPVSDNSSGNNYTANSGPTFFI